MVCGSALSSYSLQRLDTASFGQVPLLLPFLFLFFSCLSLFMLSRGAGRRQKRGGNGWLYGQTARREAETVYIQTRDWRQVIPPECVIWGLLLRKHQRCSCLSWSGTVLALPRRFGVVMRLQNSLSSPTLLCACLKGRLEYLSHGMQPFSRWRCLQKMLLKKSLLSLETVVPSDGLFLG